MQISLRERRERARALTGSRPTNLHGPTPRLPVGFRSHPRADSVDSDHARRGRRSRRRCVAELIDIALMLEAADPAEGYQRKRMTVPSPRSAIATTGKVDGSGTGVPPGANTPIQPFVQLANAVVDAVAT